jgi:arylsulfatase A-like enzyme
MNLRSVLLGVALVNCWLISFLATPGSAADPLRPNIVLCIADDWGYPWASAYGDTSVKTPNFDRVAKEGILFTQAFISSPSCTPSRSALLTGQHFFRLEEAANLHGTIDPKFKTYPDLLAAAGYFTGQQGKSWGPGNELAGGRTTRCAGLNFPSFQAFLKERPKDQPFCFWQGSSDPHRPYQWQSGAEAGIDLKAIEVPKCFPDNETTRNDIADYLFEVQRFDTLVGSVLKALEEAGELDNTIVAVTGDHGMPFPRGKCNLYDLGTRVPLAIRWPGKIKPATVSELLVSLVDLAPTFLIAGGLSVPPDMTGRALFDIFKDEQAAARSQVVIGRERHTPAQGPDAPTLAYPQRALRTKDHLYIWNLEPARWPAGIGPEYMDCDGGPLKKLLVAERDSAAMKSFFELAFARRPAEELYDLKQDPQQLKNVASDPAYENVRQQLARELKRQLTELNDPRIVGGGSDKFDEYRSFRGTAQGKQGKKNKQK